MKHLKVKVKLLLGFALVSTLTLIIGIVGIVSLSTLNDSYARAINLHGKYLVKINHALVALQELRIDLRDAIILADDQKELQRVKKSAQKNTEVFETLMKDYRTSILRNDAKELFDKAMDMYTNDYKPALFHILENPRNSIKPGEELAYARRARDIASEIVNNILSAIAIKEAMLERSNTEAVARAHTINILFIVIIVSAMSVSIVLGIYFANTISKPLGVLTNFMQKASTTGNLVLTHEEMTNIEKFVKMKDEIGQNIAAFVAFVERITDASDVLQTIANGNLTVELPLLSAKDTFGLSLKKMTNGLNFMMTKIESLLAESQAANLAKNEFMMRMSHEMLTPMNALVGLVQVAKQSSVPEQMKEYLDLMDSAAHRLLQLIHDVLDISQIESGPPCLHTSVFDFKAMLDEALKTVNPKIKKKDQTFTYHIDSSVPSSVLGDKDRLAKVIGCLLDNAVKFTPEQGEICFTANVLGKDNGNTILQMEVVDNGIGISKEQQSKLFDLFEQVDGSSTRKYGGIGLGLVLSKRIIETMGGKIWVDSELGKGAKFTFICAVKEPVSSMGN